jgi:hypothetical protein
MTEPNPKICIYPGCERPAAPAHAMGGPQPAFCELEGHNALSVHLERRRLAALSPNLMVTNDPEEENQDGR